MFYLVAVLVFALVISIFAIQNATPVGIKLLFWTFPQIPLVYVIFGTALFGLIVGILVGMYSLSSRKKRSQVSSEAK